MTLASVLVAWQNRPEVAENVVAWRTFPPRPARFKTLPADLHPVLAAVLRDRGIDRLYSHQATTWAVTREGRHPVVVTGTASGKTLCYLLPVFDTLLRQPEATGLLVYPTKALAHDQLDVLSSVAAAQEKRSGGAGVPDHSISVAAYDGDTSSEGRSSARRSARLIVTNPDMLHTGILPHHADWSRFFGNLKFVVLDEVHTYRGVFGSHVANVVRRLKRIAAFYGAFPQFVCTSATIGNPLELAGGLIEERVELVDDDGAGRGAKHFLVFNPRLVDRELGIRRGVLAESAWLAEDLLRAGVQSILFARTRRSVELLLSQLRESQRFPTRYHFGETESGRDAALTRAGSGATPGKDPAETVRGYRSGYLPRQRREIEAGLRSGKVRAVVATSALELGIDIGGLEAAVLAGYPGTIAQTLQQAGRAGRKLDESVAVLLTSANPLDQFLARHPTYLFDNTPEHALINPDHLIILLQHLRCAAFELPFRRGEGFGRVPQESLEEYLSLLTETGVLHQSGETFFWMADRYPAQDVSLRSASPESVVLRAAEPDRDEATATIGEVDFASANWMVHPGAIYLHEGQSYLVEALDLDQKSARMRPVEVDFYTEPKQETTIQLTALAERAEVTGGHKAHGDILVTTQVVGYRRVLWQTRQQLDVIPLDMPATQMPTTGYWLSLSAQAVDLLREEGAWGNDANDYGPGWPLLRRRVRERDGYRCRACGANEAGQAFHVHHVTPFRLFASPEQANQPANLVTLCPACHRQAEAGVRVRSGLAGLSFVLGHLAPLFLMCDSRDVGVHADPASPLADGQPAVVVYDAVPAGIGFSRRLFEVHDRLVRSALELVATCDCADGCPSCVGPGGEGGLGAKTETLALLRVLCREPAVFPAAAGGK